MRNGAAALQKALYNALKNDEELIETLGVSMFMITFRPRLHFLMSRLAKR